MDATQTLQTARKSEMRLLSETQVSERTGIHVKTLQNWRVLRKELPFLKLGRLVRYESSELERWLAANKIATDETGVGR